jgi:hypothetical protein
VVGRRWGRLASFALMLEQIQIALFLADTMNALIPHAR